VLDRVIDLDAETVLTASDPVRIVAGRTALGGSAPERVREHCQALERRQAVATRWRDDRRAHAQQAEKNLVAAAQRLAATGS